MNMRELGCGVALLAAVATAAANHATAGPGPKGHTHATFNAGAPGDPRKASRVIEIIAKEGNGTMVYDPPRIEVALGEQIKFVIKNVGELDHEFMLDTVEANAKHAKEMEKHPEMEHDDPNGKRVLTKKDAELIWKFTRVGIFEYACMIPGHYEAGMKGIVEVRPKPKAPALVATSTTFKAPGAVVTKAKPAVPAAAAAKPRRQTSAEDWAAKTTVIRQ